MYSARAEAQFGAKNVPKVQTKLDYFFNVFDYKAAKEIDNALVNLLERSTQF